ncbi:MAG: tRNA pseudouridine(54/55) synthase Pus10 [Candidatus Aenigmatarchaeota archaeon]
MEILEKAKKILRQPVCDNCLGRQFAQLLHGYNNKERGKIIRTIIAMSIDKEDCKTDMDLSNFSGFKFHNFELKEKLIEKKCSLCNNIFEKLDIFSKKAIEKSKNIQFNTFLVGTKLSFDLISKEEELWEHIGIDYCEPIKAEINREVGKLIEKKIKARFNPKNPDVNFIIDIEKNSINIEINPIFIYGEYQKLIRGIPQTKWPSKKYKTSVEEIIAKPFMLATHGKEHKFHGLGREDIDARCLAWRPFVLEIIEPKIRNINLKEISKKISNKIKVKKLRISNISEVRKIKEARVDKTYHAIVECDKKITKNDLEKLKSLITQIRQKTPTRVLHRRADKLRKRNVKYIKAKLINSKKFNLVVRCEAGLYVKELISGDNDRTKPSVSEILGCNCRCKELDVIKIERYI